MSFCCCSRRLEHTFMRNKSCFSFFSLERSGKAAAHCCVPGSSYRAGAPFLLKQDSSTSRGGRVVNSTPPDRVLLSDSSRITIVRPQILVCGFLFISLQGCFSSYCLSTDKAESHDTPDFAWHELTHLSELTDCQPK